jgi:hypothetical protein
MPNVVLRLAHVRQYPTPYHLGGAQILLQARSTFRQVLMVTYDKVSTSISGHLLTGGDKRYIFLDSTSEVKICERLNNSCIPYSMRIMKLYTTTP